MKIIIESGRRNPEVNKERNNSSLIIKYYRQDVAETGETGLGNYYISFTDIPKIGINPKNVYGTPTGIYCYPVKQIYKKYIKNKIPFASDRKYIQVLKLNTKKVLYSNKYTDAQLQKDINKLKIVYRKYESDIKENWDKVHKAILRNYNVDSIEDSSFENYEKLVKDFAVHLANINKHQEKPFYIFWTATYILSMLIKTTAESKYVHFWNGLIRGLGYEVIVDNGFGAIHPNEKTQTVFLIKTAFEHVDMIKNSGLEFITVGNQTYTLNDLPDTLVIDDLSLSNREIAKLPSNLTVKNTLNLSGSFVRSMPKKLVAGTINISNSKITALPEDTEANIINASKSKLEKLPNKLKVNNLDISNTNVRDIGVLQNAVLGKLDISNTWITKLPENLKVGTLNISNGHISEIPDTTRISYGLVAKNVIFKHISNEIFTNISTTQFILDNSNIMRTNKGIAFADDYQSLQGIRHFDGDKNPVEYLPSNLDLVYMNIGKKSKLKELPRNLHVGNTLRIYNNKKIREIPGDLRCNTLNLDRCGIRTIQDGLRVITLYIGESYIKEIPAIEANSIVLDKWSEVESISKNAKVKKLGTKNYKLKELHDMNLELLDNMGLINTIDNCTIDLMRTNMALHKVSNSKIVEFVGFGNNRNEVYSIEFSNVEIGSKLFCTSGVVTVNGFLSIPRLNIIGTGDIAFTNGSKFNGILQVQYNSSYFNNVIINGDIIIAGAQSFGKPIDNNYQILGDNVTINGNLILEYIGALDNPTFSFKNIKISGNIYVPMSYSESFPQEYRNKIVAK